LRGLELDGKITRDSPAVQSFQDVPGVRDEKNQDAAISESPESMMGQWEVALARLKSLASHGPGRIGVRPSLFHGHGGCNPPPRTAFAKAMAGEAGTGCSSYGKFGIAGDGGKGEFLHNETAPPS
jgi:hypothetical protein